MRLKLQTHDFDIKHFGGWDRFSELMHGFYVSEPWFFGYKCPQCDQDDFTIVNNPKTEGVCHQCLSALDSFFSLERTKKYIAAMQGFHGRLATTQDGKLVGWIMGCEENLNDLNETLPPTVGFNIGYICVLPEFRIQTARLEKIRQLVAIGVFKRIIPHFISSFIFYILGDSPVIKLHTDFINELRTLNYKYISSKISNTQPHLEKFTRYTGYKKIGPWKHDTIKNIWIKKIA